MTKRKFLYFLNIHGINLVASALLIIGLFVAILGHIFEYGTFNLKIFVITFYSNFGTEFISIALTVLILDKLSQRRQVKLEEDRLKNELLGKMSSQVNDQVIFAIEQLSKIGLLHNGDLNGANFSNANFHQAQLISSYKTEGVKLRGAIFKSTRMTEAWLYNVDLEGSSLRYAKLQKSQLLNTNLRKADLQGANFWGSYFFGVDLSNSSAEKIHIEDANLLETNLFNSHIPEMMLRKAQRLRGSIMPDGNRYNGKYNLAGDLDDAKANGIDIEDPIKMAEWYVVTLQSYQDGQKNL